jgi:hypothetical protein
MNVLGPLAKSSHVTTALFLVFFNIIPTDNLGRERTCMWRISMWRCRDCKSRKATFQSIGVEEGCHLCRFGHSQSCSQCSCNDTDRYPLAN